METNTKIVQAILLFLFFTIFEVSATEIFPSEEVGDFIIGKDATPPASVTEIAPEILEEVILEFEFEVSNDWNNLLGGMMLQLILLLLIS